MIRELAKVADELGREKGVSRELLAEALKDAIIAAVGRKIGKYLEPEVSVDLDRGHIDILVPKEVSEDVTNKWFEIDMEEAKKYKEDPQLGDVLMVSVGLEDLGRQAALVAKQKLFERLRDAERQVVFDQFNSKKGDIVNGTLLKSDRDMLTVNIGKTEAILPRREMMAGDYFNRGDYVRALLLDIKTQKGWPQLVLSRTHPEFMRKLFETEIPEVFEGIIDVKSVAREPGDRAKVAVYSQNSNIDPVGACIGLKGSRINSISHELRGEKIDVVEWSPDPVRFVCNAISPAEVVLTNIFEDEGTIEVIVPDDQLSLAIGKKGQNVRLAARLTDWRIDVLKESEYAEIRKERLAAQEQEMKDFYELYNLENLDDLSDSSITNLLESGIDDIEKLSNAAPDELMHVLDVSEEEAVTLINQAIDYLSSKLEEAGIFEEGELDEIEENAEDETEGEEGTETEKDDGSEEAR